MKKVKNILWSLALIFGLVFINGALAQEDNAAPAEKPTETGSQLPEGFKVPTGNVSSAVFGGGEYVPTIKVKVGKVTFDATTRKLNIATEVNNESDNFLDNLKYTVELRKGDKLNNNGPIFSTTEYVYSETNSLKKIAPKEVLKETVTISVPKNIVSGSYFLQMFVNDKNIKFQDVDYTRESFQLTGDGGRMTNLMAYFVLGDQISTPMAGPATTLEDKPLVVFPLDRNAAIEEYLKTGKKVRAKVDVISTTGDQKVVKTFTTELQQKTISEKDSLFFELLVQDGDTALKQGGSFDVNVYLIDEKDVVMGDSLLRWMIDFGQIMGRIMSMDVNRNVYKKGETLNIGTELALYNTDNKTAILELSLKGDNNFSQTIAKEISLEGKTSMKASFDDKKISGDTHLTNVNLTLKDKDTGTIVDTYNMDIDFEKAYGVSAGKVSAVTETTDVVKTDDMGMMKMIASIVAALVFISIIGFFLFKKK